MPLLLDGLGRMLAPISGVEGEVARRQLSRYPARTALTAGVLFVAVVTALAFGQSLLNTLRDLRRWCHRAIPADFLVRASRPDTAFLLATALEDSLGDELARLDGVAAVDRISFLPARVQGRPVLVLARTFDPQRPLPLDLRGGGAPENVRRRLAEGGAVLDVGLARSLGVGPGGRIVLETARGPRELPVAGTATEYAGGGSALYLEWETARRLLSVPGTHAFLVTARPGSIPALAEGLRDFCAARGLLLQSNPELSGEIDHHLARVTAVLWGLMSLAFLVASLGIANTLTLNVRQQARDLAVLRALGMTRPQTGRVVSWQALLLGLAALVPGVGGGVGLAYLLNRATNALNGRQVSFRVDVLLVLGACGLALAVGQLAALLPGRRAAGVRILHALRLG
jgi:putative ABC transport system permease protein